MFGVFASGHGPRKSLVILPTPGPTYHHGKSLDHVSQPTLFDACLVKRVLVSGSGIFVSSKKQCCIDDLPPEIISEILSHAIDTFNGDIRLKCMFPLLVRGVSKRFYHITTNNRVLWRYLYIRQPLHPYLNYHIVHSGTLSLVMDAMYNVEPMVLDAGWAEMTNFIIRVCSRLARLVLCSLVLDRPITEILCHTMPVLKFLDVEGTGEQWTDVGFPRSRFPALQFLRSRYCFDFETDVVLPDTLEEMHLEDAWEDNPIAPGHFWTHLPPNLRVFRSKNIVWEGLPSTTQTVHLPCLVELSFTESCWGELGSILQCLDARALRTLTIASCYHVEVTQATPAWSLACPALTHLKWTPLPRLAPLDVILRNCNSLKSLHIDLELPYSSPEVSISDFMIALANNTALLPSLEDFMVHGASIPSLKYLAQARPRLKSLKVYWKDLGWDSQETPVEDYLEWKAWLESQVTAKSI